MATPAVFQSHHVLLLILGCAICALAGILLMLRWRSLRRGDSPHCRKCDYNLTGLELGVSPRARCPECGVVLSGRGVVLGERVRRRGALAGGLAVLAIGLAFLIPGFAPMVAGINWYQWKPGDLVIQDLDSNDSKTVEAAVVELGRRIGENSLWFWQRRQVISRSLDVQAQRISLIMHEPVYLEWLGVFAGRDQLSAQQRQEFLRNSFAVTIAARPQALARFGVPMRFDLAWRGPNTAVRGGFRVARLTCDGNEIAREKLGIIESGRLGTRDVLDWLAPVTTPGRHNIRAELELEIRATTLEKTSETVSYTELRTYDMPVEVFSEMPSGAVSLVSNDPAFRHPPSAQEVQNAELLLRRAESSLVSDGERQALRLAAAELKKETTLADYVPEIMLHGVYRSDNSDGGYLLECGLSFAESSSIGLAFDVIVKWGGEEHNLGGIAQHIFAHWSTAQYVKSIVREKPPATVLVVLRPSPTAAMMTFDLTRIYAKELRYEDVPVTKR